MVCGKCGTFFCWLCEECLNPRAPYKHFSNPASKCYNLLFYGIPALDDDDDDDRWWNDAGVFVQNADDYDDDDYDVEDDDKEDNHWIKNFFRYLQYIKKVFGMSYSFVEYHKWFWL